MRSICGYIFKGVLLLLCIRPIAGQDTLRIYGPRIGIDLARAAYIFADPSQIGADISVDAELFKNIYPVIEFGYSQISDYRDQFDYTSKGSYARAGADYDFLPPKDRSEHHNITVGFRYGISFFNHRAKNIVIPGGYWGENHQADYEKRLTGNWIELAGGMKTEVASNFFLGWSVRFKILLNPEMDPILRPKLVPGYGDGTTDRGFGISYSVFYKIPLFIR